MRNAVLVAVLAYGSSAPPVLAESDIGQTTTGQALEHRLVAIEGRFARYLRTPAGRIVGVVLEDGTRAELHRGHGSGQRLRRGDRVLVRADVAQGLPGPYLVDAEVTRVGGPEPEVGAKPTPAQPGPSPYTPRKRGDPFSVQASKKTPPPPPAPAGRVRKAAAKVKAATTGAPPNPAEERHFSRRRETSGP